MLTLLAHPRKLDDLLAVGPLVACLVLGEGGVISSLAEGSAVDLEVGAGVDEEVAGGGLRAWGGVALHVFGAPGEGGVDARLFLHRHSARPTLAALHHVLVALSRPAGQRGVHVVKQINVAHMLAEVWGASGARARGQGGGAAWVQAVQGAVTSVDGHAWPVIAEAHLLAQRAKVIRGYAAPSMSLQHWSFQAFTTADS